MARLLAQLERANILIGRGVAWLTLAMVIVTFTVVVLRYLFDIGWIWLQESVTWMHAAVFMLGAGYTLARDEHVRVDVFYARFSPRGKAWANSLGCVLLGLPICWVILTQGMWSKGSSLNSPLLSFEISQSGFGMYTKYMMAGFLVVFALSMTIQFASYFVEAVADLRGEPGHKEAHGDLGLVPHR